MNKITQATENRSTVLYSLFLLDMSMFNDLVIKNDLAKKVKSVFFYGGGSTASRPSLGTRRQNVSLQGSQ